MLQTILSLFLSFSALPWYLTVAGLEDLSKRTAPALVTSPSLAPPTAQTRPPNFVFILIEFYEDHPVELYHLRKDLGETTNLADVLPQKVAQLRKRLSDWRKAVNAQMMTPNPDYRKAATGS